MKLLIVVALFLTAFLPLISGVAVCKAATPVQIVSAQTYDSWGNPDFFLNRGRNMTVQVLVNSDSVQDLLFHLSLQDEVQTPSGFLSSTCHLIVGRNVLNFTFLIQSYAKVGIGNLSVFATDANGVPVGSEFDAIIYIQDFDQLQGNQPSSIPMDPNMTASSSPAFSPTLAPSVVDLPNATISPSSSSLASPSESVPVQSPATLTTPQITQTPLSQASVPEFSPVLVFVMVTLMSFFLVSRYRRRATFRTNLK